MLVGKRPAHENLFVGMLFVYSASIPFESLAIGGSSIVRYWALAFILIGAPLAFRNFQLPPSLVLIILAPSAVSAVSYWWSIDQAATWERTVTFLSLGLVTLLISGSKDPRTGMAAVVGLVSGAVIASFFVFRGYEELQSSISLEIRATAGNANSNDIAATLAIAGALSLGLALTANSRRGAWLGGVAASAVGIATLLTASRTAAVSLLLACAIAILLRTGNLRKRIILLAGLTLGMLLVLPELDQRVVDRLSGTYAAAATGDFNFRQTLWSTGWHAFLERPLVGWGGGTFERLSLERINYAGAAHNSIVNIASQFGILGILAFVALGGEVFRSIQRCADTRLRFILIVGSAPLIVNMFLLSWDYRKLPWLFLAIALHGYLIQRTEGGHLGDLRRVRPPGVAPV